MELAGVTRVLGGEKVLGRKIRTRMDLIELSNRGVTKSALVHLAKFLSLTMKQVSELLPVNERTIQRYTAGKHFNRAVTEQILHIAEVVEKGIAVFEDKDKFIAWMKRPSKALAHKTPMSLLHSRFGAQMVMDELVRIEHGVYS